MGTTSIFKNSDVETTVLDDVTIVDTDWVKRMFMVPDEDLLDVDAQYRYWSSADNKFTDTSLGGNIAINPRPQFTPYADIPVPGRNNQRNKVTVNDRTGNFGMGRYYSEAIDDNAELIYFEFGIPRFNSLFDFFSKSVDYVDSVVANTGRSPAAYRGGQLLGGVAMLVAFPIITLTIWFTKTVVGMLTGHGAFNYYYLEPTMHTYWGSVNTIVTQMATEMGILIPELMKSTATKKTIGTNYKFDQDQIDAIKKIMPGLISDNNYIDVFAIATKAQTMANRQLLKDRELFENSQATIDSLSGYIAKKYSTGDDGSPGSSLTEAINSQVSFENFVKLFISDGGAPFNDRVEDDVSINTDSPKPGEKVITDADIKKSRLLKDENGRYPNTKDTSNIMKFAKAVDASVREGGAYATFKVDFSGSVSESFSNSTGEIGTKDSLKSLAQKSRDVKFSMSGGNVLGDTIKDVMGYTKDIMMGALDSVTFGASNVVQTLLGGGYIDIPKKWEDSTASFPQINYTIQLISPYGNTFSQLQNIYIPLAMLLAGTMPQATGRASYTSPFLCSIFNKGKQNIKLGMITSLSITRGTSNLAFNKYKKALAIDVSFTVTDFSEVMPAPVSSSIFNIFSPELQDDTKFSDYIATLASRDLLTSKYAVPKAKLRLSRQIFSYEQSIAGLALATGESLRNIFGPTVAYSSAATSGFQRN